MNISFSGPSGVGKTTLILSLTVADDRLVMLPSCTTRAPRPAEKPGIDYEFISTDQWHAEPENSWVLVTSFNNNFYGIRKSSLFNAQSHLRGILLNVDESGAKNLRVEDPACINILILPPSASAIHDRLKERGEPEASARYSEVTQWDREWYHHVVINDEFEACKSQLLAILKNYLP